MLLAGGALELAADEDTYCYRTSTGRIVCTEATATGEITVADAQEMALWDDVLCVRRSTGSVQCARVAMGATFLGSAISGLTDAIAIDGHHSTGATFGHFCAARATGSVKCWNSIGMTTDDFTTVTGAVDVSVGNDHACLLRANGTMACWGSNSSGQLGSTSGMTTRPVDVPGITDALSISAGAFSTCVRRRSGPHCWGSGALGWGTTSGTAVLPPP